MKLSIEQKRRICDIADQIDDAHDDISTELLLEKTAERARFDLKLRNLDVGDVSSALHWRAISCERCGGPKEGWQRYCGAACSAQAEAKR